MAVQAVWVTPDLRHIKAFTQPILHHAHLRSPYATMEAPEAIVANSHHHAQLLNTIADLEYVPQARKQQTTYIKDLESQVSALKQNITLLAAKTKKERKEHETLRDSTSRRFAHKLIGKKQEYMAKESKEERYGIVLSSLVLPLIAKPWSPGNM